MIYVKNISNKVIGIPAAEGGDAALLPDATMAVDDAYELQVDTLVGFGLAERVPATQAPEAANDNTDAAPETQTAAEKKPAKGRTKKDA